MATTWIGPFGALLEIGGFSGALPQNVDRPSSETRLLSGFRHTQSAPGSARKWTWTLAWTDAALLVDLEQGAYGDPPWRWYDVSFATENMLPVPVALAGSAVEPAWWLAEDASDVVVASQGVTLADGRRVPHAVRSPSGASMALTVPRRDGVADPVPVIAGVEYTASMHVAAAASSSLGIRWVDANGAELSTDGGASEADGRWSLTATAPANAEGALLEVASDGRVGALQLNAGQLREWTAGRGGVPRVTFAGEDVTTRIATAQARLEDVTVEVLEVG